MDASGVDLNDTWTWNGSNWAQQFPTTSPPVRRGASIAYDIAHRQVVLFGGYNDNTSTEFGDTWTWDGSNWTQQLPTTSPSARDGASVTYDGAHNATVLFGGNDPYTSAVFVGGCPWAVALEGWSSVPGAAVRQARSVECRVPIPKRKDHH